MGGLSHNSEFTITTKNKEQREGIKTNTIYFNLRKMPALQQVRGLSKKNEKCFK
jgi:hypothetical protein